MENIIITDARTLSLKTRRAKEIKQLKDLIHAREQKAQSTERYLRMFGRCRSVEAVQMLQEHLRRTIDSIWKMRCDLAELENTPPPCSYRCLMND